MNKIEQFVIDAIRYNPYSELYDKLLAKAKREEVLTQRLETL